MSSEGRTVDRLKEAADLAADAEMSNDGIGRFDIYVLPYGICLKAERHAHSQSLGPRSFSASRQVDWPDLTDAETSPLPALIAEVVEEFNAKFALATGATP